MSYRKVVISKFGSPDVLHTIEEEHLPEPKKGEVRIKVLVTSASFTDTLLRRGIYPDVRKKPPFSPGYDMVGIIDKRGESAGNFKVGQKVASLTVFGAYSEYICLAEDELLPVPNDLDSSEVVSLILTYMTAYQMLHRVAKIQPGQTILVHGAGGAVGTALIQLGGLLNLKIYGTAKKSKHNMAKNLGAIPIDYESEDFVSYIKNREVQGIDAVFDGIGGNYFKRSFSLIKQGGILVAYGFQKAAMGSGKIIDFIPSFINLQFMKMFSFKKSATFYAITTEKKKHPDWFKEDFNKLLELLQLKKIKPVISEKMPLTEAVRAHKILDKSAVEGKIILIVNKE